LGKAGNETPVDLQHVEAEAFSGNSATKKPVPKSSSDSFTPDQRASCFKLPRPT